jgi:hypothetical protein
LPAGIEIVPAIADPVEGGFQDRITKDNIN